MTLFQTIALYLLRGYKYAISPLFPPSCRYVPTCSEYAMDAIAYHGVLRGSLFAVWRLLRCHPFSKGGLDPVRIPEVRKKNRGKNSHAPAHAARACSH
jgi:uncharacterized protein